MLSTYSALPKRYFEAVFSSYLIWKCFSHTLYKLYERKHQDLPNIEFIPKFESFSYKMLLLFLLSLTVNEKRNLNS